MLIAREQQTHQSKSWSVRVPTADGSREYRAICYWSGGELRMTWLVEVYVPVAQGTSHWRRIKGSWIVNAVREWENKRHEAAQK